MRGCVGVVTFVGLLVLPLLLNLSGVEGKPPPCETLTSTHAVCAPAAPCPTDWRVGDPTPVAPYRCFVLDGVSCTGPKNFTTGPRPCGSPNGHRFPTAIALSLTLGFLGADRFYLGHTVLGLVKLFTLGGAGIWWMADLVLLASGSFLPANGAFWEPH